MDIEKKEKWLLSLCAIGFFLFFAFYYLVFMPSLSFDRPINLYSLRNKLYPCNGTYDCSAMVMDAKKESGIVIRELAYKTGTDFKLIIVALGTPDDLRNHFVVMVPASYKVVPGKSIKVNTFMVTQPYHEAMVWRVLNDDVQKQ